MRQMGAYDDLRPSGFMSSHFLSVFLFFFCVKYGSSRTGSLLVSFVFCPKGAPCQERNVFYLTAYKRRFLALEGV